MSSPFTLRIVRPYASRDEFLQSDCWTVDRTEMLLVGVEGVSQGAHVNFEIVLENREVVVRGEGRALELIPPNNGRPGGVRIRFKQLDSASKSTLRKALEIQKRQAAEKVAAAPAAAPVAAPPEAAPDAPAPEAPPLVGSSPAPLPADEPIVASPEPDREETSGIHRVTGPIPTPGNREALLERLRERARLRKGPEIPPVKSTAAAE
jgi:hypothetical protein